MTVALIPSGLPDWDAARARSRREPWAARLLERIEEDFARWRGLLDIPAPGPESAWTHHYFCDDGSPLTFDPASPHRHVCPACGRVREGELLDGAWRTWMHNAAASQAQRCALVSRLSADAGLRDQALGDLAGILRRYAREYADHAVHGDKVGRGKVMPQSLDEAIWAIALLRAVRWASPDLPDAARDDARTLAAQVAEHLEPQADAIHNIPCWVLAALAECAVATGDEALLARARSGPFGISRQIREGFRAEGIWYETSAFYHFYALAALLSFAEAAGPEALDAEESAMLAQAIAAPAQLAYSDGRLPAYGDCWPWGRLEDFQSHVAVAAAVLPGARIDAAPYRDRPERADVPRPPELWIGSRWNSHGSRELPGCASVAALVLGPGPLAEDAATSVEGASAPAGSPSADASFLWPDAGVGALVGPRARVTMRFGRDVGMHDHHDRLAVDVEVPGRWASMDLGSGGYGSAFTTWMRSAAAHSIGSIHDEVQPRVDGVLEEFTASRMTASAAWDDKLIRRQVTMTEKGWDDVMELSAGTAGPLHWTFHGDGTIRDLVADDRAGGAANSTGQDLDPPGLADGPNHDLAPTDRTDGTPDGEAPDLGTLPGIEHYRDVQPLVPDPMGTVRLSWDIPGAPVLEIPLPPGMAAWSARADGNPSGRDLGIVIVRGHAPSTRISARFLVP